MAGLLPHGIDRPVAERRRPRDRRRLERHRRDGAGVPADVEEPLVVDRLLVAVEIDVLGDAERDVRHVDDVLPLRDEHVAAAQERADRLVAGLSSARSSFCAFALFSSGSRSARSRPSMRPSAWSVSGGCSSSRTAGASSSSLSSPVRSPNARRSANCSSRSSELPPSSEPACWRISRSGRRNGADRAGWDRL